MQFVKHLKRAGLQFAICYEDQTVKHMIEEKALSKQGDVAHGQKAVKWLADNWFRDEAYLKLNGRPVLLVFGPEYFTKDHQWEQIMSGLSRPPMLYGLPDPSKTTGIDGAFGWPDVTGGHEVLPDVWRKYLHDLYTRREAPESVISVAFPGFRDIYEEAGQHDSYGSIDDRNGGGGRLPRPSTSLSKVTRRLFKSQLGTTTAKERWSNQQRCLDIVIWNLSRKTLKQNGRSVRTPCDYP